MTQEEIYGLTTEQIVWLKNFIIKYSDINAEKFMEQTWWYEDYEKKDMEKLFKQYPDLMLWFDPMIMYELQKFYNEEWMSASWCGVFPLDIIYNRAKQFAKSEWGEDK